MNHYFKDCRLNVFLRKSKQLEDVTCDECKKRICDTIRKYDWSQFNDTQLSQLENLHYHIRDSQDVDSDKR